MKENGITSSGEEFENGITSPGEEIVDERKRNNKFW